MNRLARLLVPALVLLAGPAPAADVLRVLTLNIRYDEPRDGANRWEHRREAVSALVDAEADLAGLQEALAGQVADLRRQLPAFDLESRGREVEPDRGEACPVLWRRSRFERLDGGTFWLSDTPEQPGSRTWGNTLPRICTWVELRDRRDQRRLRLYNVHLDHASPAARARGLDLARRHADAWTDGAALLIGDFNEPPSGPAPTALRGAGTWADAWPAEAENEGGTFNGWRPAPPYPRIDYIFHRRSDLLSVTSARTPHTRASPTGGWVSDHFPVIVCFTRPLRPPDRPNPTNHGIAL